MYGDDSTRYRTFTRRTAILAGGKVFVLALLAGRMYQLQVIEADRYSTLAEENRISLRLLLPRRGRIVDRYGVPLAVNRANFRLQIVAEQARNVRETLTALSALVPVSDDDTARVLEEIDRHPGFVPVTVRENLDWEEVSRVEVNSLDLPGVMIDVGQSREYPFGAAAAHVVGYVGAVTEDELTGDPLLALPDFRIGKSGIEKAYDARLRGTAGTSQVEVNALGRVVDELSRQEGQRGDDVQITLDMEIQRLTMNRLAQEMSASAVAMDVNSGEVLVLASSPSFDSNEFVQGLSSEYWKSLVTDPRAPLTNKAISGLYSPGSTFKMVVALAAIEAGIPADTTVFCGGHMELGNARFHCWKKYGHGWLDLHHAIQQSCDVYFYELGKKLGIERISKMATRLGLGAPTGIEIPGEKGGLIPTPDWKRAVIGVPWQLGETLVAAIGQGFILTTPLQLAVITARVANGGRAVTPTLILKPKNNGAETGEPADAEADPTASLGVSRAALDAVVAGMTAVTNSPRGTAFRARIREEGMEMAGKSGTSQVRRISKRERETGVLKNDERPWKERDHALFVAFAPVQAPRYAAAVVVEHGGSGSGTAAPIVHEILLALQRKDRDLRARRQVARVEPPGRDS